MSIVYLFKFPEYIHLVKTDQLASTINWPMIQYDTKVFKGVTNNIEFIIRNNDRKPIKLVDCQLEAQIQKVNVVSNSMDFLPELQLIKSVVITDDVNGKAKLILCPEDIQHWAPGYYQYVVNITYNTGISEFLYTDVNKNTFGNFELLEGVSRSLAPAIEIVNSTFYPSLVDEYGYTLWAAGPVKGDAQIERANGTHTVAVYQNNFTGKFAIQGSLSNDDPMPDEWFYIPLDGINDWFLFTTSNNYIGPTLFNFTLNVYWLRFIYKPDPTNIGTVDKVLYKG